MLIQTKRHAPLFESVVNLVPKLKTTLPLAVRLLLIFLNEVSESLLYQVSTLSFSIQIQECCIPDVMLVEVISPYSGTTAFCLNW